MNCSKPNAIVLLGSWMLVIKSGRHPLLGTDAVPFNLDLASDEFTILECAQHVIKVTGSKSKITYEPLPQDDPKQRCPDITKARTLLGWEPQIDLETGLGMSLEYFRKAVAGEKATTK